MPPKEPDQPEGRLLIVDEDYALRRLLHATLLAAGFEVAEAASGEEAVALAGAIPYDVVLLDLRIKGKGGIATCRELRRQSSRAAILVLNVSDAEDEKVEALEAGADDYILKPFLIRELTARIRASMRRLKTSEGTIRIEEIELFPARRLVLKSGQRIHTTPKEFDLLHYLMAHAGSPVTHARLLSAVWGQEYVNRVGYLRSFIRQLRKKLESDSAHPRYILTDSYFGYRFHSDSQADV